MSLVDQQWCPTSVQVTALQARGLRIKGKSGTNDAYAVIQVGKEKYQTSVVEKSVSPVWKEEATFELPHLLQGSTAVGGGGGGGGGERSTLRVHVLHRALVGPDKLLGQAVINLPQLSEDKTRPKTEWFKLLDKTGKPDKDRGEVLVDIQFMRNSMTASMFDLSAAGKSRSRLGKFKDKVRGKKKESDSASSVVPSFPQVMTDSEDEANGDDDGAARKDGKSKKHKIKSLFSPKSNLQRNMSQSMSVLPAKNSSLSGSQSSGLNVDSSEGKKKFKFMIHKRTGSSDSKESWAGHQKQVPVEQSNLCINGSHVYCEEPPPRTSRIGSNFSLASSGHGSMEDVPESSPPSVDSLRAVRQYSPWMEEEEEEEEEEKGETVREDVDKSRGEDERIRREEEEETIRRQQEELKLLAEEKNRQEEEEKAKRMEEERMRREEERVRREEQRLAEEKERLEEERARFEEEKMRRREEERIRREEEERRQEEERQRQEEHKLAEERRLKEEERKIEEENLRREEEQRREEERRRKEAEEEHLKQEAERRRQREEEERLKKEEVRKREEEERARKEKEEAERLKEKLRLEEEWRIEAERIRKEEEERRRMEEELLRKEEEKRARIQKEIEEKRKLEEQEKMRVEQEKREREEKRKEEELQRLAKEKEKQEEERRIEGERVKREEEERLKKEEDERRENDERMRRQEMEKMAIKEKERLMRLKEEKVKRDEEEEIRREEERRKEKEREEQERIKKEEEEMRKEKKRREEAEEKVRKEKEVQERLMEETRKLEEQEKRRTEEKERVRRLEEKRRAEEERTEREEQERIRREEEEERRQKEEQRARKEEEENERLVEIRRLKEQEKRRIEEEEKIRREERGGEQGRKQESKPGRLAEENEEENKENYEQRTAVKKTRESRPADVPSTNPFDETFSQNPSEEVLISSSESDRRTAKAESVKQRCQAVVSSEGSGAISCDEKDMISTQREKRQAPQPPRWSQAQRQTEQDASTQHLTQINKQSRDKDVKTASVLPQRSVQTTPGKPDTDAKDTESPTQNITTKETVKHTKRPAPSRPCSVGEQPSSESKTSDRISHRGVTEAKQVHVGYGLNPFEDDDDDNEELAAHTDASVCGPVQWPPAKSQTTDEDTASQVKVKSMKIARAPPPPAKTDATSCSSADRNNGGGRVKGGEGATAPKKAPDAQAEVITHVDIQESPNQGPQQIKVQNITVVKEEGPPASARRLQPVKPLNPLVQSASVVQEENDDKSTEILAGTQDKTKVNATGIMEPYSQLTKEELICLVLKQDSQLLDRDKKISELEQYIDNLLVRVMEEQPSILMSMTSMKKPA